MGTPSTLQSFRKLISLVSPHKIRFCCALLALAMGSAINLLLPELVRRGLAPGVFQLLSEHLALVILGVSLLFVVQGAAFFLRSYLFGIIGQRVYGQLREDLFRAVIQREISFFDHNRSGDLAARINSDAALVQDAVAVKLSVIIRYGAQVVFGVVLMACMSWRLTGAIVVSVLSLVGVSALFVRNLRGASRAYQQELARLTTFAAECFSGVKILRALAAEREVTGESARINRDVVAAGERRVSISASFSSGASLLLNLLLLLVLWYGVTLVLAQSLALNELAAFVLYGGIVAVSFSFLLGAYSDLMQAFGGLERVFELLTDAGSRGGETPSEISGEVAIAEPMDVEFREVSFLYPSRPEQVVLNHLSMRLAPGEVTALVGPSGAGKSSIVQLLLGLYRCRSGAITINGRAIESYSSASLREHIAWVPQEPELFGFSVVENLMLGNKRISRDEALQTIRAWDFLDFVDTLPQGIDTVLGEHGTLVSGGQRQRIAIARALLRRPTFIILDEATSGLDSHTESKVMSAIRTYLPRASILVISHRLATVHGADTIYVINEGRVFERGTHRELSQQPGLYREYVARQTL